MSDFFGDFITEEHNKNLPTVRIQRAVIENFKSVEHGEIVFNCAKQFIPYGTEADLLGIYGQNGSGKTAFIQALSILKAAMKGTSIDDAYADCIKIDAKYSKLEFEFELQYPNGDLRNVIYSFKLKREKTTEEEKYNYVRVLKKIVTEESLLPTNEYKVILFDECISISEHLKEKKTKMQPILDTSDKIPFGPISKRDFFIKNKEDAIIKLEVNRRLARQTSKSFIFMEETLECFHDEGIYSGYYQTLLELNLYAKAFLFVVDTRAIGAIQGSAAMPFFFGDLEFALGVFHTTFMPESVFELLDAYINAISVVMSELIPGLNLYLKKVSDGTDEMGDYGYWVEFRTRRGEYDMPLRYESDGVRKIISIMILLIKVYDQHSTTIAIDELDAGVFEYLLGEILQIIQESGKGQLIFTSHNLRPLEVLNKKYLCFTTTNSKNRYYRFKNVGKTNNLRSTYYREILLGEQDEELYKKTKKHKTIAALRRAAMQLEEYMEE